MAYFLIRTYKFLVAAGVHPENIRFRQHMRTEMAHYANDCWDAEIETSLGWVEAVGHANRSAFDLECHAKGSKKPHFASRNLAEPREVTYTKLVLNKGVIGKSI